MNTSLKSVVSAALLFGVALLPAVHAAPQHLQSGAAQVQLIELYTSEGCSSCPPADKRLSKLKHDPALWVERVPVAFHVDYWDYIGWQDPYADADNSNRQREHEAAGSFSSVYTPGFLVDGQEWRGFFRGARLPSLQKRQVGPLSIEYDQGQVVVNYQPAIKTDESLRLQLAWLGAGLQSSVSAGENRGKKLSHDFVVLQRQQQILTPQQGYSHTGLFVAKDLPAAEQYALVGWLEETATGRPVQAVGGWVEP